MPFSRAAQRCATILLLTDLLFSSQTAFAQIAASPTPGISVEITDVLQFPDTRGLGTEDSRVAQNIARIGFLKELPDASDRWFVNDVRGELYMVDATTNTSQVYLNLRSEFSRFGFGPGGLSTGMLGITPHPEFATNGKFYTSHTEVNTGSPSPDFIAQGNAGNITGTNAMHEVITEWTATDPTANVFSGTSRELLRVAAPLGFLHGFGELAFNPLATPSDDDYGLLYIGGGDSGYDAYNKGSKQAQRLDSIFGKIMRIDPSGNNSANGSYGIPNDNPYATDGNTNTLDEIFASGFRNAHRVSWDLETGVMYATDIGQNDVEEVNIIHPGANYGWSEREGTFVYSGGGVSSLPGNDSSFGYTYPVAQYDHDEGDAIAGGFVYRGSKVPDLFGKFVYGDIRRGRLFYSDVEEMTAADDGDPATTAEVFELFLTRDGVATTLEELILDVRNLNSLPSGRHDLRFGQTSNGELYVITKQDGWIRQLVEFGLPGDYNDDGVVNAADYTVFRDNLGQFVSLPNEGPDTPGQVTQADYDLWASRFGRTSNSATLANHAVPEPASWLWVMVLLFAIQSKKCFRALSGRGSLI